MKGYLTSLNERDKWLLFAGVVVVVFYLYYLLLYSPLSNAVDLKTKQLIEKTQTLDWMKSIQHQAKTTKPKQAITDNQLLTLLDTQLKDNKSLNFPYQIQQTGSGDIQLSFNEVPFLLFVSWLSNLNENYTIHVIQFNVEPTTSAGVVKLMIILSGV